MTAFLAAYALLGATRPKIEDAPIQLQRQFVVGQKSTYSVKAAQNVEQRVQGLNTFLPDDEEIAYDFYTRVMRVDAGVATLRYSRPTMTVTGAATPDADPVTTVEKTNYLVDLSVSPANQILDEKDLNPPKKDAKPASGGSIFSITNASRRQLGDFIGPFVFDMIRLSAFVSFSNTTVDLEPSLPLTPVKVGDTWKRTVSYQPQKLQDKVGKMAVQRLDMTYTYNGPMLSKGKHILRIHAETHLDSDLATYINGLFHASAEATGLKSIPNKLTIGLDFDLDPKTLQTVYAEVNSKGGFQILLTQFADPVEEVKVTSKTTMDLVSNVIVPPTPKK
jgi:hypothetical protein